MFERFQAPYSIVEFQSIYLDNNNNNNINNEIDN